MSIAAFASHTDLQSILKKAKLQLVNEKEVVKISQEFTTLQNSFGRVITYIGNINKLKDASIKNDMRSHKALLQKKRQVGGITKDHSELFASIAAVGAAAGELGEASKANATGTTSTIGSILGMLTGGRAGSIGKFAKIAGGLGVAGLAADAGGRFLGGESAGQIAAGVGGGALGMAGGSLLGARIGAIGGAPGAAIGGLIGGAIGYMGGSKLGDSAHDYVAHRDGTSNDGYSRKFADFVSGTVKSVNEFLLMSPLGLGVMAANAVYNAGSDAAQGIADGWNGSAPAGNSANAGIAMNYFMQQNWSKEQSAGIVGNLQQESSRDLNPNAKNSIGMYGIAQWDTNRRNAFQSIYKKSIYGSSLQEQLAYVQYELVKGVRKGAGDKLRQATTATDAAKIVVKYYEGAAGQDDNKRIANANALAGNQGFFKTAGNMLGGGARYVVDRGGAAILATEQFVGDVASFVGDNVMSTAARWSGRNESNSAGAFNSFISRFFMPWNVRSTPWCAAFVNAVLGSQGLPGTGSGAASSFRKYGGMVWDVTGGGNLQSAARGDIAVFRRPTGTGHVAFLQSLDLARGTVTYLGGNQSDKASGGAVNVHTIRINDRANGLVAIRRINGRGGSAPATRPAAQGNLFASNAQSNALGKRSLNARYSVQQPGGGGSSAFPLLSPPRRHAKGNGSMLMANPKPQYTWYFTGQ